MPRSISTTSSTSSGAISNSPRKASASTTALRHICGERFCGQPDFYEVCGPMKITEDSPPVLTALDRPNSYIGRSVPRPNLARLTQGRGQYVSDVTLPRMAHVAFVRSPHAHARIISIGTESAKKAGGVIAVVTGVELAKLMTPWVG